MTSGPATVKANHARRTPAKEEEFRESRLEPNQPTELRSLYEASSSMESIGAPPRVTRRRALASVRADTGGPLRPPRRTVLDPVSCGGIP
jgi:hypothetical protein